MKKNLFLAALAGVALVGCAKNEVAQVTDDSQITFNALTSLQTKATEISASNLTTNLTFNVFAWYQANTVASFDPTQAYTNYMENVNCTYTAADVITGDTDTGGTWSPSGDWFWPKNGKLTFSAYSSAIGTATATCDATTGLTIDNFEVNSSCADQVDLLVSDRKFDCTNASYSPGTTYDGVDLIFRHALSSIHFCVYATGAAYATDQIRLDKITILNAYAKGKYLENRTTGKSDESYTMIDIASWTPNTSSETSYEVFSGSYLVTNTNPATELTATGYNSAILLPQTFNHTETSKTVQIQVDYSIKYGSSYLSQTAFFDLTTPYSGTEGSGSLAAVNEWKIGRKYIYHIGISLDKVYFSPKVEDWVNVDMNNIVIN